MKLDVHHFWQSTESYLPKNVKLNHRVYNSFHEEFTLDKNEVRFTVTHTHHNRLYIFIKTWLKHKNVNIWGKLHDREYTSVQVLIKDVWHTFICGGIGPLRLYSHNTAGYHDEYGPKWSILDAFQKQSVNTHKTFISADERRLLSVFLVILFTFLSLGTVPSAVTEVVGGGTHARVHTHAYTHTYTHTERAFLTITPRNAAQTHLRTARHSRNAILLLGVQEPSWCHFFFFYFPRPTAWVWCQLPMGIRL